MRYLAVPVVGGPLRVEDGSGVRAHPIESGRSYSRPAGVEHHIGTITQQETAFVEIDFGRAD
jgi:hypothetical protein